MIVILAEKPSVARAIANTLGHPESNDGYITAGNYIVTWAIGHLISLSDPAKHKEEWKYWNLEQLPMLPENMKLSVNTKTSKQYKIVKELINHKNTDSLIFATDAGPQGELIARWIYIKSNCKKPVQRLWISSITQEAIEKGMRELLPSEKFDTLFLAAQAQARADWIVGLNCTRAVTLSMKQKGSQMGTFTTGRVQTPTLYKIVQREREIQSFVPEAYYEIEAVFEDQKGNQYTATYYDELKKSSRIDKREVAEAIIKQISNKSVDQVDVNHQTVTVIQPQLPSLPVLQQQISKKYQLKVAEVDKIAQDLYEQGLITYTRTADQLVTPDVAAEFPDILSALSSTYKEKVPHQPRNLTSDKRYVGGVTDHHAIIATGKTAKLNGNHAKIFDFIAKTLISVHHPVGTDIKREIRSYVEDYLFLSHDQIVETPGWRMVWDIEKESFPWDQLTEPVRLNQVELKEEETAPPARFTEASLIKEMERIHLGTPATRTGIIETLYRQEYIAAIKRSIRPLEKAEVLIDELQDTLLLSEKLTKDWETKLEAIRLGTIDPTIFDKEIDAFTTNILETLLAKPSGDKKEKQQADPQEKIDLQIIGECPLCKNGSILQKTSNQKHFYGCNRYPNCNFFVSGMISGVQIQSKDIHELLRKKRTPFYVFPSTNRPKETYKARFVLNEQGEVKMEYEQKGLINRLLSIMKR